MKVTTHDGGPERKILIGMATDPAFLGRAAALWSPPGLFASKWANVVGGWCVHHHRAYGRPPGRALAELFADWEQSGKADGDSAGLVGQFLASVSEEYERADPESTEYLSALADKHFNLVRLRKLRDALEGDILAGDHAAALGRLGAFAAVAVADDGEVDVLLDEAAVREALDATQDEDLVPYPGPLAAFFRGALTRGSFVGVWGPEKRGKTNVLLDLAWRGMLNRKRVAFFEVGDMSRRQIMRRFMCRAALRPFRPGRVRFPAALKVTADGPEVVFKEREFGTGLSWRRAWKACRHVCDNKIKSDRPFLKLRCYPTSTVSAADIKGRVEEWVRGGWVPDVVVVDYADILKPVDPRADKLERVNQTWAALRSLSLSGACPLVLTATQTTRASYAAPVITLEHTSDDKRKAAHVTGAFGLNRTREEKSLQLLRFNWVAGREWDYNEYSCWTVAGCPAVAHPCVLSAGPV